MKKEYCARAEKPCRSKEDAEAKADASTEYRRAYRCEFCDYWHLTSRLRREDEFLVVNEPEEWDAD
jgi:hypothetical protein